MPPRAKSQSPYSNKEYLEELTKKVKAERQSFQGKAHMYGAIGDFFEALAKVVPLIKEELTKNDE